MRLPWVRRECGETELVGVVRVSLCEEWAYNWLCRARMEPVLGVTPGRNRLGLPIDRFKADSGLSAISTACQLRLALARPETHPGQELDNLF
jgi:hypothetical protein